MSAYLDFVRTLPCCYCGNPHAEPHHIIGIGMGGMGMKARDLHSMPLCRTCHNEVHHDTPAHVDAQVRWMIKTQKKAFEAGVLVVDPTAAKR